MLKSFMSPIYQQQISCATKMFRLFLLASLGVFISAAPVLSDAGSDQPMLVRGDLNGDGNVDIADAIIALQLLGWVTPVEEVFKSADVDQDGKLGMAEAIHVLQIIAQIREPEQPSMVTFTNSLGMTFNLIPAGTFMMGSPEDEPMRGFEETQHEVTLTKPYYMQTTEVTQGQWKAVIGSNPSWFSDCGDDCPVEQVSWNDIQTFITELNKLGQGTYRLPTEAEWEYAARAGTTTPFNRGNCLSTDQANYDGKHPLTGCPSGVYREKTLPVGCFAPNAWGLYDMHGNVREWVHDWYGSYPSSSVTDPTGPSIGSRRVLRSGNWDSYARYCRSANRSYGDPDGRYYPYGFRLVLPQVP
jgi:formylglycine-generating enzyme